MGPRNDDVTDHGTPSLPAEREGTLFSQLARRRDRLSSMIEIGLTGALHASVTCGKDLRAVYDCNQQNETLTASRAEVIADCHERDGIVKPGASQNEIICEVAR